MSYWLRQTVCKYVPNCKIAKIYMNFVSNAIVCLFDFFSLNLCLHFLVLFLFCHPYLISSLFWNCLLETNELSNYIGWITCLSKNLDKLEKKTCWKKKDNDIISAYLHVPLCLFPDTFFIFIQGAVHKLCRLKSGNFWPPLPLFYQSSYIMRRPQNFAKSSPNFWLYVP